MDSFIKVVFNLFLPSSAIIGLLDSIDQIFDLFQPTELITPLANNHLCEHFSAFNFNTYAKCTLFNAALMLLLQLYRSIILYFKMLCNPNKQLSMSAKLLYFPNQ